MILTLRWRGYKAEGNETGLLCSEPGDRLSKRVGHK